MDKGKFYETLAEHPIVCAVKTPDGLEQSLTTDSRIVFVLYGDILSVADIIAKIKDAGKLAFVHIDLIEGLVPRDISVQYLKNASKADGIISTKANILRAAKTCALYTVQRFFVLDSIALLGVEKQIPFEYADVIEVLPGVMPKIVKRIAGFTYKPLIASGLINDKEDVIAALGAGAAAISTTNPKVWFF